MVIIKDRNTGSLAELDMTGRTMPLVRYALGLARPSDLIVDGEISSIPPSTCSHITQPNRP